MKTVICIISRIENTGSIYWVHSKENIPDHFLLALASDPDSQLLINPTKEWTEYPIEMFTLISYLPGVTDNSGHVLKELLTSHLEDNVIYSVQSGSVSWGDIDLYFNPQIQKRATILKQDFDKSLWNYKPILPNISRNTDVLNFDFKKLSNEKLEELSFENKWAFSSIELEVIKNYYSKQEVIELRKEKSISENPNDIEIEILAQTWSEHCKHKIFNALIEYKDKDENFTVDSIYKTYIKGATFKINSPWAVSVFNDNAGIVDWDEFNYLAIKVETHNSPSALDPYGGALTGILGVNRDILGTGLSFKCIANTNVFCVGNWEEDSNLPTNIIHPKNILKGIYKGVQDGGNKSGVPTINGAICFNENFTGKPLVYCGTLGIAPKNSGNIDNKNKYQKKGDLIIMAGGAVGLDGIHGATMSSVVMDENVPLSMVQIGDPFTQKKLSDFVLACRDQGLLTGITDNGAGGLSSSVGEMAEKTNGARINLDQVHLKYLGLKPWEIFVSESQERMTLSILPKNLDMVKNLSKHFGINISCIGEFTDTGYLEIYSKNSLIAYIEMNFLHNGLPQMKLSAHWQGEQEMAPTFYHGIKSKNNSNDLKEILKTILSDRNIASKEFFIKQYDQEVNAGTLIKPIEGDNHLSPNDSGVIWLRPHKGNKEAALAVSSGIQYHFSHLDPKLMAALSFDEAMRGVIASGANPKKVAMTDNFCWPDPIYSKTNSDGEHKLGKLVRAAQGLYDISVSYSVPLISGKDSMKNDYINGDFKISVPPTLLFTAIGHIDNTKNLKKSMIQTNDVLVYKLGLDFGKNYFGHFLEKYFNYKSNPKFSWDTKESIAFYHHLHANLEIIESIHDISEGGMLVALTEALFSKQLGITIKNNFTIEQLFSEYPSLFIVSVKKINQASFEKTFIDYFEFLGTTNESKKICINQNIIPLEELEKCWRPEWK